MKKRLACVLAAALIGMGIGTSNADQQPLQVGGGSRISKWSSLRIRMI